MNYDFKFTMVVLFSVMSLAVYKCDREQRERRELLEVGKHYKTVTVTTVTPIEYPAPNTENTAQIAENSLQDSLAAGNLGAYDMDRISEMANMSGK